jgi:hypothetical protein
MAPLQKRAWYGLALGMVGVIAIIVVFIAYGGFHAYITEQGLRIIVGLIILLEVAGYSILMFLTPLKTGPTDVNYDERDSYIKNGVLRLQLYSVLASVGIWVVVLSSVHGVYGQISGGYPYLIFMSTLIINTLAMSVGILYGYRNRGSLTEDKPKGG